jgi:hypothetical protein
MCNKCSLDRKFLCQRTVLLISQDSPYVYQPSTTTERNPCVSSFMPYQCELMFDSRWELVLHISLWPGLGVRLNKLRFREMNIITPEVWSRYPRLSPGTTPGPIYYLPNVWYFPTSRVSLAFKWMEILRVVSSYSIIWTRIAAAVVLVVIP